MFTCFCPFICLSFFPLHCLINLPNVRWPQNTVQRYLKGKKYVCGQLQEMGVVVFHIKLQQRQKKVKSY